MAIGMKNSKYPIDKVIKTTDTWQTVVNANSAGTIYYIEPGTHTNATVDPQEGDVFIGPADRSAIMDGDDTTAHAFTSSVTYEDANDVKIINLKITGYNQTNTSLNYTGAIQGYHQYGWEVLNCEVSYNRYSGMYLGRNAVVRGNYVHHNRRAGIKVQSSGFVIENNEMSYNNYQELEDPLWDVGGIKAAYGETTNDGYIRRNYSHHNHGSGIWLDIGQDDVIIEYNTCTDNYTNGIVTEISSGTIIRYNTVEDNGLVFGPIYGGLQGPGIQVQNANYVDIHDNTVDGNYNGIILHSTDSRSPLTRYVDVYDNDVDNSVHWATGAGEFGTGDSGLFTDDLDWYGNSYSGNPTNAWRWDGSTLNFTQWQAEGFDL